VNILQKLNYYLQKSNNYKSSYWIDRLDNEKYLDTKKFLGFGTFSKKNFFSSFLHEIFQKKIYGNKIFKSEEYKKYKNFFKKQNRQINIDNIQHIFFFKKINEKISDKINSACVIGDGKINFLSGMLSIYPEAKIYSINLCEVLIHDYLILKKYNILNDEEIAVVEKPEDLKKPNTKLFLVPPDNSHILKNNNIDLFVNFSSFQEMKFSDIKNYFDIIKSNKSFLYTCNRYHKILPAGEILKFKDYPWGDGSKIFFEKCAWISKYYSFKYPFFYDYEGDHWHCLISYK
jgi:putative sugar O-methyltransferase